MESQHAADSPWIVIHDEQVSSEELVRQVEERVARRRAELGAVEVVFPAFGYVSSYPDVPLEKRVSPHLFYYLEQANRMPPASVEPLLAPSPATRAPVVGGLWQKIRGEMHNLVLFYVNKSVREQSRTNANLVSTLNELTRVIQDQQAEIDALRAEIWRREN
ncbi:MAG TPA: hypothetical protein PK205_01815 [Promineifilum sp.]|nr:hypothetical protein [Promineifilum sp.]HRO89293.1 hypothetical protein [Promineifilum sp.]HRQ12020.1 hypothetical protein [Promineifilum sp.]